MPSRSQPAAPSRIRSLFYGLTLPVAASRTILNHRKLLTLAILPVLITVAVSIYWVDALQDYLQGLLTAYLTRQGMDVASWSARALLWIADLFGVLLGVVTFSTLAVIVASPFNDFLAENAEPHAQPPLPQAPKRSFWGNVRLVWIDVVKSTGALAAAIFAILLSWVPVINVGAALLTFLLITFQYLSYPQTRREIGLLDGIRFLARHPFSCVGFGVSVSFLFALPLVSALAVPIAVVGGTLLYARSQTGALR